MIKKALISGITGQDGSYLADLLLKKGYQVHGIVRRSSTFNTSRIDHLKKFKDKGRLVLHYGDLADAASLDDIFMKVKPDEVYNLAAQSHVRVSFDVPEYTGNITGIGTLRMLEAMRRHCPKAKFYQASSSEMFGDVLESPQTEKTPFNARSPYGIAKVFAHETACQYRDAYGLFISCGILFNHECVTAQTPIIIKKNNLIDIVAIEEVVPHREDPLKGKKYTTFLNNNYIELWDKNKWSKIKSMTATWNKVGGSSDKKMRGIICRGGYYEASFDHISYLENEQEIKTGNIKTGNHLELGIFPDLTEKIILTAEEAEFIGMMTADGYISDDGRGRFINNNQALRERISELWERISGGYSREDKHPSGFNKNKSVFSVEFAGNKQYLSLIHKEIYTEKLFKKVSKRVLNAPKEIIISFLKGYNVCDGLKAGRQKTEFKSFTTNSQVLGLGLWYLVHKTLNLRITIHPEFRSKFLYFHLNINSDHVGGKGKHLQQKISEVKLVKNLDYTGWLFDLETDSGTFSAGVGLTWVHNSPRRGENFVTRKITIGAANILSERQKQLSLGNLDARRDWGYAEDYVEAMWLMLQQSKPDDFVIATGETHSIREFAEAVFGHVGIIIKWQGKGIKERGVDAKTGKTLITVDPKYFRPTEVNYLCGDYFKAKKILKWKPKTTFKRLAEIMTDEDMKSLRD